MHQQSSSRTTRSNSSSLTSVALVSIQQLHNAISEACSAHGLQLQPHSPTMVAQAPTAHQMTKENVVVSANNSVTASEATGTAVSPCQSPSHAAVKPSFTPTSSPPSGSLAQGGSTGSDSPTTSAPFVFPAQKDATPTLSEQVEQLSVSQAKAALLAVLNALTQATSSAHVQHKSAKLHPHFVTNHVSKAPGDSGVHNHQRSGSGMMTPFQSGDAFHDSEDDDDSDNQPMPNFKSHSGHSVSPSQGHLAQQGGKGGSATSAPRRGSHTSTSSKLSFNGSNTGWTHNDARKASTSVDIATGAPTSGGLAVVPRSNLRRTSREASGHSDRSHSITSEGESGDGGGGAAFVSIEQVMNQESQNAVLASLRQRSLLRLLSAAPAGAQRPRRGTVAPSEATHLKKKNSLSTNGSSMNSNSSGPARSFSDSPGMKTQNTAVFGATSSVSSSPAKGGGGGGGGGVSNLPMPPMPHEQESPMISIHRPSLTKEQIELQQKQRVVASAPPLAPKNESEEAIEVLPKLPGAIQLGPAAAAQTAQTGSDGSVGGPLAFPTLQMIGGSGFEEEQRVGSPDSGHSSNAAPMGNSTTLGPESIPNAVKQVQALYAHAHHHTAPPTKSSPGASHLIQTNSSNDEGAPLMFAPSQLDSTSTTGGFVMNNSFVGVGSGSNPMYAAGHSHVTIGGISTTGLGLGASIASCNRSRTHEVHEVNELVDDLGFVVVNGYILLEEVGRGKFGVVYLASSTQSGAMRAVKVVPKSLLRKQFNINNRLAGEDTNSDNQLQREIAIMKKLRHKNIVALLEVIDDPADANMYLIMPYVERGSIVKTNPDGTCTPLDLDVARGYLRQIAAGLHYLHEHKVAHRDIKPDNLLLGSDGVVYLTDFGVSDIFDDARQKVEETRGTPAFAAPEMITGEKFALPPTDVWAFGVTMFVLIFGRLPFRGGNLMELNKKILEGTPDFSVPYDADTDYHFYGDAVSLLKHIFERNPHHRPSIGDVRRHRFFRGRWSIPDGSTGSGLPTGMNTPSHSGRSPNTAAPLQQQSHKSHRPAQFIELSVDITSPNVLPLTDAPFASSSPRNSALSRSVNHPGHSGEHKSSSACASGNASTSNRPDSLVVSKSGQQVCSTSTSQGSVSPQDSTSVPHPPSGTGTGSHGRIDRTSSSTSMQGSPNARQPPTATTPSNIEVGLTNSVNASSGQFGSGMLKSPSVLSTGDILLQSGTARQEDVKLMSAALPQSLARGDSPANANPKTPKVPLVDPLDSSTAPSVGGGDQQGKTAALRVNSNNSSRRPSLNIVHPSAFPQTSSSNSQSTHSHSHYTSGATTAATNDSSQSLTVGRSTTISQDGNNAMLHPPRHAQAMANQMTSTGKPPINLISETVSNSSTWSGRLSDCTMAVNDKEIETSMTPMLKKQVLTTWPGGGVPGTTSSSANPMVAPESPAFIPIAGGGGGKALVSFSSPSRKRKLINFPSGVSSSSREASTSPQNRRQGGGDMTQTQSQSSQAIINNKKTVSSSDSNSQSHKSGSLMKLGEGDGSVKE